MKFLRRHCSSQRKQEGRSITLGLGTEISDFFSYFYGWGKRWTPAASSSTFPHRQVRRIPVFRPDRFCLKFWVIWPENWNSTWMESGRGLLESARVEAHPRRRRTVANGGTSAL
ncbi:hypothetical protein ACLB2K_038029 [Fragaria x ananassa]